MGLCVLLVLWGGEGVGIGKAFVRYNRAPRIMPRKRVAKIEFAIWRDNVNDHEMRNPCVDLCVDLMHRIAPSPERNVEG